MRDKKGNLIHRGDFVKYGKTTMLVTKQGGHLELWDFRAWAKGYYDAYIPLETEFEGREPVQPDELVVVGSLHKSPEMLPKSCGGYNGEPHAGKLETIWTNPKFKIKRK